MGSRLRRTGEQLADDRQALVLAKDTETGIEEERERAMEVIGVELAVAGLEREGVDQLEAAGRQRLERPAQERARDAATSSRRGNDKADDCCSLEWLARQRRWSDAHAGKAVRQLMARLCIHPADDFGALIGDQAFHFTDLDACLHRLTIAGRGKRRPADRLRHVVVAAIAFCPFRIVGKRRAALMVEEAQKLAGILGAQGPGNDRGSPTHAGPPPRGGFSMTRIAATVPGGAGFTPPVSS